MLVNAKNKYHGVWESAVKCEDSLRDAKNTQPSGCYNAMVSASSINCSMHIRKHMLAKSAYTDILNEGNEMVLGGSTRRDTRLQVQLLVFS